MAEVINPNAAAALLGAAAGGLLGALTGGGARGALFGSVMGGETSYQCCFMCHGVEVNPLMLKHFSSTLA